MYPIVYLNNTYVPKAEAALNVADLSILRGYGVFDYFRYTDGQPHFVEDHLDRFLASAEGLALKLPVSRAELRTAIDELIGRNGQTDGGIRLVLTGGYAPDGYTPTAPNLLGMAYPFQGPPAEIYERGVSVLLHHFERQLPRIKTIDYLEGIRIQPLLRKAGADFPLYVDREHNVREADRSNYMIVRDGVLITPKDDILLGITRMHLLRLARRLGIYVDERAVSVNELKRADEAIICSSTKGALAITFVDGAAVGDGRVGPVTRQLMDGWDEVVRRERG